MTIEHEDQVLDVALEGPIEAEARDGTGAASMRTGTTHGDDLAGGADRGVIVTVPAAPVNGNRVSSTYLWLVRIDGRTTVEICRSGVNCRRNKS